MVDFAVFLAHEFGAHLILTHVVSGMLRDSPRLAVQVSEQGLRALIPPEPKLDHEPQVVVEIGLADLQYRHKLGLISTAETSTMPIPGCKFAFDAVYYHVTDMEKSIAFYRDVLGLRLASRDYVARFDLDGVLFELVPSPSNSALSGTGNARLSLGVTDIGQAT